MSHQMQSKPEGNRIASSQCAKVSLQRPFIPDVVLHSIRHLTSLSLIGSPFSVQCFHHNERWLLKLQPSDLHPAGKKKGRRMAHSLSLRTVALSSVQPLSGTQLHDPLKGKGDWEIQSILVAMTPHKNLGSVTKGDGER